MKQIKVMKRIYSIILFSVLALCTNAATTIVTNSGNNFTPEDIVITVGDTVQFNITNAHDVVEVSQSTYNLLGTTSNGGFILPWGGGTLTGLSAGTYYFVCTPHAGLGMVGTITVNAAAPSGTDLLISGVFDGQPSWASNPTFPKGFELYATANISDLSIYGVSSANNGSGPTGSPEFAFPSISVNAGDYLYVCSDSTGFHDFFGFAADFENSAANINGDDAIELFQNGAVVDVFGDVNLDGTGQPWEYLDGWAYRVDGTGPDGSTFVLANWTFSAIDDLQGATSNATSVNPFPIGTYQLVSTPKINIQSPTFTMNEGDPTTIVTNLTINPTVATATSFEIHLVGGNGSSADIDLSAYGGGPFPITIPVTGGTANLTVPITPVDDAVYEGTETFEFVLRNATGGLTLGNDTTFLLTFTDNELPPDTTVNVNPTSVNANEGSGTIDLTFEIGQLSAGTTTFTVDLQLNSGDPADIGGYTTQTISFPSTGTTTETVTITLTDDVLIEGNEMFIFELVNPSAGLTLGANVLDTLILSDNDFSTYTIASVTTVDANGSPDSLTVACEVAGVVMGINYADGPDVSFYIHDGTGGMGVYDGPGLAGYPTVTEGDQVTIQGEVGFFNGLTQMVNIDTIIVTGTATLPTVLNQTAPIGEAEEGELVKLSNVTVVDQSDWNTGGGAGFNLEVTDGTNTYSVRIDKSADLFNMTLPGCVLDVTGIGTQFDNSSPYTSGYQMLPRYMADITVITPCVAVTGTIGDATEVDPVSGEPVNFGTVMTLKGIITSPDFRELQGDGTEFSFADATGGIWAYSTDSAISFDPMVGDSVEVNGEVYGSSGVTRIRIATVTSLGTATPFTPTVVTSALDESHEAELITLENLTISSGTWATSGGSYNISATNSNGTYDIRIDADRAELFQPILSGGETFHLTGIGTQFDPTAPRTEGYQVLPRFDSDIEIQAVGINEIELANFSVSPVPATEVLNVQFDFDTQEVATARLINVIGQVAVAQEMNLLKGSNQQTILVGDLNPGFYVLQIETSKGVNNTSVLIK